MLPLYFPESSRIMQSLQPWQAGSRRPFAPCSHRVCPRSRGTSTMVAIGPKFRPPVYLPRSGGRYRNRGRQRQYDRSILQGKLAWEQRCRLDCITDSPRTSKVTIKYLLHRAHWIQINHIVDHRESAIDSSFSTNGRLLSFAAQSTGVGGEHSAADKFNALIQDCGVSPHKIAELLQELPPKNLMNDLIDYYFDHM